MCMTSKKYAISNPSAIIALKYGKNVSRGILGMEREIVVMTKELHRIVKELESN